jgi:UDP-glucose:glycoprotein glucosyltransferase
MLILFIFKDIDVKAAQMILASQNPLNSLVQISQDFPKYAHIIARTKVDAAVRIAIKRSHASLVPGGVSKLYLNNLEIDLNTFDVFRYAHQESSIHVAT